MVNRIDAKFRELRESGRKGFVAYITGGDPSIDASLDIALALDGAGVDFIELGVPFSDPLADGATIQAAANRALRSGANVPRLLDMLRAFRRQSKLPVILFTYLNPVYAYGFERFHADASAAGADGVLILDLPPDEEIWNAELAGAHGLLPIRVIAPTTPPDRMRMIAETARGFIYYVSREGVTGEQPTVSGTIASRLTELRQYTALPIAVGFGISTPGQAAEVARTADAAVVGSAIVRCIERHGSDSDVAGHAARFVKPLVDATHECRC